MKKELLTGILSVLLSFGFPIFVGAQDCPERKTPESRIPVETKFDADEYSGWEKFQMRGFSIYLPATFRRVETKCLDTECYEFASDFGVLKIDASPAAGYPTFEKKWPRFCEEFYWINDYFAWVWHIQRPNPPKYESGVLFSSNEKANSDVGMYLFSTNRDESDLARKIFKSVTFLSAPKPKKEP